MVKKILKYLFLAAVMLFIYTPIFVLIFYSFTDTTLIGQWKSFSVELYKKLFADAELMAVVGRTLLLAVIASSVSVILGTAGAIGIYYSKKRAASVLSTVNNLPVVNAEIVTALSLALTFALVLKFMNQTWASMIVGHVVITLPFVVLSVMPRLKQMDANVYEAALDLGASPARALFTVVIPEILPGMLSGFMLSVTLSLDDYIVTTFTKPSSIDTISTYVYNAVKVPGHSALPELRALSALIFLAIILVVVLMNVLKRKEAQR